MLFAQMWLAEYRLVALIAFAQGLARKRWFSLRLFCEGQMDSGNHAQAERDAFIGGIHFTAAFFADAMRGTSL